MTYETLRVHFDSGVCHMQIDRPLANNTINEKLVTECHDVLSACEASTTVVILSGSPTVFCFGADFKALAGASGEMLQKHNPPGPLYDLWQRLAAGPYVTVAHVRGKVNAGGIGFVAACDLVLADESAQFSLSELLFGLYPACVLPFLIRRIGFQKAHALTLMTHPIAAKQASEYGLVDAVETPSEALVRRHLLRLRRLSKPAVRRYKAYMSTIGGSLTALKEPAVAANVEMFSDPSNLQAIRRYVEHGVFPWEKGVS